MTGRSAPVLRRPADGSVMTCASCHRPMRPRKASPEEFPGTIREGASGRCHSCAYPQAGRRQRGKKASELPKPRTPEMVRAMLLADRARRGVPAGGLGRKDRTG